MTGFDKIKDAAEWLTWQRDLLDAQAMTEMTRIAVATRLGDHRGAEESGRIRRYALHGLACVETLTGLVEGALPTPTKP